MRLEDTLVFRWTTYARKGHRFASSLSPAFTSSHSLLIGQLVDVFLWAKLRQKRWLSAPHLSFTSSGSCLDKPHKYWFSFLFQPHMLNVGEYDPESDSGDEGQIFKYISITAVPWCYILDTQSSAMARMSNCCDCILGLVMRKLSARHIDKYENTQTSTGYVQRGES